MDRRGRSALLITVFLLAATFALPTACTAIPTPTSAATLTFTAAPAGEITPVPTAPPSPSGPLPRVVATLTLDPAPRVCTGGALAVDAETGFLYTAGALEGPCLSVFDPAVGQALETRDLPFAPLYLQWDGGMLYAVGQDGDLLVADAATGEIVARRATSGMLHNGRAVLRDGWAYLGLPGDLTLGTPGELHLLSLRDGSGVTLADAHAFDLADDGRIATVGGLEATTVRVYAGPDGTLIAEREIGPGTPGESLAFVGQTDRLFVVRALSGQEDGSTRFFLDVLDATTLATLVTSEGQVWQLTPDPARGRVYGRAPDNEIVGFDAASGQMLGTLFTIPQGEPQGFSSFSPWKKLSIEPATGRVYVVSSDFDGGFWAAVFGPADGTAVHDVQVPGALWALDSGRSRLYFAGSSLILALDSATLHPVVRLPLSRQSVSAAAAPEQGLLFIGDAGGDVHVFDLQTRVETQLLEGVGGYVDVDLAHGWLYAGDGFAAGISVYDLETLELRGVIPQPGNPVASPADGRVYIVEEDVYSAEGETLEVIRGRTQRNPGCNGCSYPTGVVVDPTRGLTVTTTYSIWVGKAGPSSRVAVDPATGRAFVAHTSGGYRIVNSLALYADLTCETLLAWRSALYGQMLYNPTTDHLYMLQTPGLLVLDGDTLDIIGTVELDAEGLSGDVDLQSGRVYLLAGSDVLILEAAGGRHAASPPQPVAGLSGPIEGILPVPGGSIFVRATAAEGNLLVSHLYRSLDGGQTWEMMRGGLPYVPNDLAFASDGTLYAASGPGFWRDEVEHVSGGQGVYRSTDGGDTWAPLSVGLAQLQVERVHVTADDDVVVLCKGIWPDQQSFLVPTIWRLDAGDRWGQVDVPQAGPYDEFGSVPITYTQALQSAWFDLSAGRPLYRASGGELQRSTDAGVTWETLAAAPLAYFPQLIVVRDDPPVFYWLTQDAVYRSTDEGASWARLSHPALAEDHPTAFAVAEWNGVETLFVGADSGALLVLAAAEGDWTVD